jgi:hypothetical protein
MARLFIFTVLISGALGAPIFADTSSDVGVGVSTPAAAETAARSSSSSEGSERAGTHALLEERAAVAADVGQQPLFPEAAHLVSRRRLSSETGAPPSTPPASPPALREFLGTVSFVIIIVVALVLVAVCNGIGYLCYIRADQWFPGTALAELSRASVVRKSMVFIDAPAGTTVWQASNRKASKDVQEEEPPPPPVPTQSMASSLSSESVEGARDVDEDSVMSAKMHALETDKI